MKYKILVFLGAACWVTSSCNEDLLDKVNPNDYSLETFYRNAAQSLEAVNAVYAGLQANNLYNREYFFLHDLLSDDCQGGGAQLEAPRGQVLNYVFDGSNKLVNDVWQGLYRIVHRANLVIANVPNASENITDDLKNRIVGEARFLRAWAYFDLVSLWGAVPLLTEIATTPEGTPRASSETAIYEVIMADLAFAEQHLPDKGGYAESDKGRAVKQAAQALMARVILFQTQDYAAAQAQLQKVIDFANSHPDQLGLTARFLDNFQEENENNVESIFEVQFSEAFGTNDAWNGDGRGVAEITFRGQEYGPNAWRNVIPSDGLVAEFEANDPRSVYSFYRIGDLFNNESDTLTTSDVQGNTEKPSWKKYQMIYKRANEELQSGINFRVIRYADVLLMMAECMIQQGNVTGALGYMNQVRDRADVMMPHYPTAEYPCSTPQEAMTALIHERRVELAGEQIRNRDIRRWRKAEIIDIRPSSNYQANKHELLPIPFVEIDNNSALEPSDQNPGY
ncbi:Starch-binding associating with outer membrane [Catalinimonas alkaloidigena]|uniref:Starch-binding associating with outer membrane n=1 Tax=Catalinimonas alkaloidigena TaxID=1075417 RepID=A0A1G9RHF3_9BACT|nr:RagB/SusD family nutrient uptake outer membrane protein [Catalinimonas alkaloidigena]SDM22490.1 Starch-binding associating with outer membrane [Catalinimonas alkaloidigena]